MADNIEAIIAARWRSSIGIPLDADEMEQIHTRNRSLWGYLRQIVGTEIAEPNIIGVHSARILPACLVHNGSTTIVWDAGLGTVLSKFASFLPYPQSEEIKDAYLHQVCALRLLVSGRIDEATAHATYADDTLRDHEIDRWYEYMADAETQFDVWLTTEMQERFILAHEQVHYVQHNDSDGFHRLTSLLREMMERAEILGLAEPSPLRDFAGLYVGANRDPVDSALADRSLDKYAWYLRPWMSGIAFTASLDKWVLTHAAVRHKLENSDELLAEAACDIFGALAVCMDAHIRKRGWSAVAAAVGARLALSARAMITDTDKKLGITSGSSARSAEALAVRGQCLELFLPILLGFKVAEIDRILGDDIGTTTSVGDYQEVIRLAGECASGIYFPIVARLRRFETEARFSFDVPPELLELSGFIFERPSSDHQQGWLFRLGVVRTTAGIDRLAAESREFVHDVECALGRHQRGDWGDVYPEDAAANSRALWREFEDSTGDEARRRGALYSCYTCQSHTILVKTDPERETTTIYLPSEM